MDIELWLPRLVVAKGWGGERGMELETGVSGCRFLYVDWIRSKALLCSTENYIQHAMTEHNGKVLKNYIYIYIYMCIYIYI